MWIILSIATTIYKWPWIYFPEMSFTNTDSGLYLITVMILSLLFSIFSLKCRGIYLTIHIVKLFLKMVPVNWQDISTKLGIFLMVFVVSQASLIHHSCFSCLSCVSISDLLGCCGLLSFINFEKFHIIIFFKTIIYLFIFGCIESSLLCVGFL